MSKKILIPTDGSEFSRTALAYGIYCAGVLKARIRGLYIIDIKVVQGPLFDDISGFMGVSACQDFIPMIERGLNEKADEILKRFREQCEAAGVEVEVTKATGLVDETIIEEGEKADWIILAQRGEHYPLVRGGLMGSTSESVVRKSGKPVMITPLQFKEIRKVGIAFDGSEPSRRALDVAVEVCRATGWPLSAIFITDDSECAATLNESVKAAATAQGVELTVTTRQGKEEQEIVQFTGEDDVDLLVMGAYGRSRVRELILGSTTSYVIRKTTVPVLLIR